MQIADTEARSLASPQDAQWLSAHWMPFTGNRNFKAQPRIITAAKGAYYTDADGRQIFDGLSGLWCSGLGHGRSEIAEAIGKAAQQLDYSPAFQFGHPALRAGQSHRGPNARGTGACVLYRFRL